jgi:hypothetical protein
MIDRELTEKLDVLRPGSDDLDRLADESVRARVEQDLDVRALYDRLQSWDAKVATTVRDVETPAGLEQQLWAKLGVGRVDEARAVEPKRRSRRWAMSAAVVAAAAALLVMVFGPWDASPDLRDGEDLLAEAMLFYRNESKQETQPFELLAAHPLSDEIKSGLEPEWRRVSDFLGYSGVAYEFQGPGANRATLYVIAAKMPNVAIVPRKDFLSSGHWASVWQEDGPLVYVLVIRGGSNLQMPEQWYLKRQRQLG